MRQPRAGYQLGCLYIGANDVRSPDWDVAAFSEQFRTALEFLAVAASRYWR